MTQTSNCLLLRYEGGHVYIDRSNGGPRVEQYVEMRGFRDRDHAIDVGEQILALNADIAERVTLSGPVRSDAQIPALGYGLGDRLGGDLVQTLAVSQDATGNVTVTPELVNPLIVKGKAMERRLQRAAAGVTGEYATPTINQQDQGRGSDSAPPEWSQSDVVVGLAPAWTATRPYWLSWLEVVIEEVGTGTTRVQVMRQLPGEPWVVLRSAEVGGFTGHKVVVVNQGFPVGSKMTMVTPSVATGASGLTVSPRGTMV